MTLEKLPAVESHLRVLSEERTAELLGLHVQTLRRRRRAGIAQPHIMVGLHKYDYRIGDRKGHKNCFYILHADGQSSAPTSCRPSSTSSAAKSPPGAHALLIMDRAGWHGANDLAMPENITAVLLPPYSPELNAIERLWLYLKERFLSHRVWPDDDAIVEPVGKAWQRVTSDTGRIKSLCSTELGASGRKLVGSG